jgi:O-antigen ligase
MLLEYGIIGTVPFLAFIVTRFFAGSRSKLLSGAVLLMYLFLSGSLLQPHTIYLFYVLVIMMPMQENETEETTAAQPAPGALALGAAT